MTQGKREESSGNDDGNGDVNEEEDRKMSRLVHDYSISVIGHSNDRIDNRGKQCSSKRSFSNLAAPPKANNELISLIF